MLSHDEKIDVYKTVQQRRRQASRSAHHQRSRPPARRRSSLAKRAAKAGADGLMVVPSPIYHTNREETVANAQGRRGGR
jgi:dihydrodipicolinate synthase/N-acetylneuraminate lyase